MQPVLIPRPLSAAEVSEVAGRVDLEAIADSRFGDLVEGTNELVGGPDFLASPTVAEMAIKRNTDGTWSDVLNRTVGEALLWRGVGATKVRAIIRYTADAVRGDVRSIGTGVVELETNLDLEPLAVAAAWGLASGHASLPEVIAAALEREGDASVDSWLPKLADLDLRALAGAHVDRFDPAALIERFVDECDERQCRIIEGRLAVDPAARVTLEEIGQHYDVSRERIRQVEAKLLDRLERFRHQPDNGALDRRISAVRDQMGAACPVEAAADEVLVAGDSLTDELMAHLAGPYRLEDGWYLLEDFVSLRGCVLQAFESVAEDGVALVDELVDALARLGFRDEFARQALDLVDGLQVRDERVLDWRGGLPDKAVFALTEIGEPSTAETIFEWIGEERSFTSLKNALGADDRMHRVTRQRWALVSWGGERYDGIVPAMIDVLEAADGPVEIATLIDELEERFSISKASVTILSGTHPAFVNESGLVRLRRSDEPYEVTGELETSPGCFVVNGAWAYRYRVDHDVLRGSGRALGEPYAASLGLRPGYSSRVDCGDHELTIGWYQNPMLGSTRKPVLDAGGVDGDLAFLVRGAAGSLDLRVVAAADVEAAGPIEALVLSVGLPAAAADDRWYQHVAESLGFGLAIDPTPDELRTRLVERGEDDLVQLFGAAMASGGDR